MDLEDVAAVIRAYLPQATEAEQALGKALARLRARFPEPGKRLAWLTRHVTQEALEDFVKARQGRLRLDRQLVRLADLVRANEATTLAISDTETEVRLDRLDRDADELFRSGRRAEALAALDEYDRLSEAPEPQPAAKIAPIAPSLPRPAQTPDELKATMAGRVAAVRPLCGTCAQVAQVFDRSPSWVKMIEAGRSYPPPYFLAWLAEQTGRPIGWFYGA